jgi:phosphoglycolate phosphatase-like HAD superfamily hydrolase
MIGDRDSDIAAGLEAGCKTIFINRHLRAEFGEHAHLVCESLEEAIDLIAKYDS